MVIRQGKTLRTKIMYGANTSWEIIINELKYLESQGLIFQEKKLLSRKGNFNHTNIHKLQKTKIEISYHLTPNGMKALLLYQEFNKVFPNKDKVIVPITLYTNKLEPEPGIDKAILNE